ncbi:histidine-containing phosphotransfer protein 2-like [Asparagus officinalis]|uniref:histidine-containing phosphotransfer protein 2-like n=1 Tax=Asparagus officinalis TaxID=4686 RepID=UPI00098E11B3|nr:histidine-containing phosphotransfer protein 2-like [Asparagus officinalis]
MLEPSFHWTKALARCFDRDREWAAMSPRRRQRMHLANSMIAEGLLDQQFNQLLMLEEDGSGFLAEVIKLFCDDSERMMSELSNLLDQDVVDYQKVDSFVHQLKGSSSSIGAHNIMVACVHFRQYCEVHDKQGCLRALNMVKHEYYRLQAKFSILVQLSRDF